MAKRGSFRPWRVLKLLACIPLGLVLGFLLFVGLVEAGIVRSPFAPALGGDIALAQSDRAGVRVLFVGNSLTFQNSTPALVRRLAAADDGAAPIFAVEYVAPGWRLQKASRSEALAGLVRALPWDAVVLQEASRIPSLPPEARDLELTPFALDLDAKIDAAGSRTVLFMTWGYRDGDTDNVPGDTFDEMQARLAQGYWDLGARLSAVVAPVGFAWSEALRRDPGLELWADDGKHSSRLGSYLAACVLYATLSGRDPRRSTFTAGLPEGEARLSGTSRRKSLAAHPDSARARPER